MFICSFNNNFFFSWGIGNVSFIVVSLCFLAKHLLEFFLFCQNIGSWDLYSLQLWISLYFLYFLYFLYDFASKTIPTSRSQEPYFKNTYHFFAVKYDDTNSLISCFTNGYPYSAAVIIARTICLSSFLLNSQGLPNLFECSLYLLYKVVLGTPKRVAACPNYKWLLTTLARAISIFSWS